MSESTDIPVSANTRIAGLKIAGKLEDAATVLYYETTLWRKLALHDDEKALQPSYWLPTPLFQRFRNRLKFHVNDPFGMTYVYSGARRSGKTTAAVATLQLYLKASAEGAPCLYVDAGSSLRLRFRASLGVPDHVDDQTFVSFLCKTLKPAALSLPTSVDKYSNALSMCPPVFVIDNVESLALIDVDFIEILYKKIYNSRVLLFILTDDESIANVLCALNGKARIQPLTDMFSIADGRDDWDIVECAQAPLRRKIARGIMWTTQTWTVKKLSKLVKKGYDTFNWSQFEKDSEARELIFIEEGDLPDTAIRRAAKIVTSSAGNSSVYGVLDDPEYNDDD